MASKDQPLNKPPETSSSLGRILSTHHNQEQSPASKFYLPQRGTYSQKTGGVFLTWELVSTMPSGSGVPQPISLKCYTQSPPAHTRDFAYFPGLHGWLLCAWNAHLKLYHRSTIPWKQLQILYNQDSREGVSPCSHAHMIHSSLPRFTSYPSPLSYQYLIPVDLFIPSLPRGSLWSPGELRPTEYIALPARVLEGQVAVPSAWCPWRRAKSSRAQAECWLCHCGWQALFQGPGITSYTP